MSTSTPPLTAFRTRAQCQKASFRLRRLRAAVSVVQVRTVALFFPWHACIYISSDLHATPGGTTEFTHIYIYIRVRHPQEAEKNIGCGTRVCQNLEAAACGPVPLTLLRVSSACSACLACGGARSWCCALIARHELGSWWIWGGWLGRVLGRQRRIAWRAALCLRTTAAAWRRGGGRVSLLPMTRPRCVLRRACRVTRVCVCMASLHPC